ncbi:Carboxylesterase and related proteins [Phaffia rhodozyma]|uniref:Carboxylesterase and related proteins n=1 Tax=Phaffia rhodozyma TaxID=264483 RepID=A0A0F7SJ27_PHARH|nr:Carboxylesterase and related proteins [Phaffia rhodozyma]
MPGLPDLNRVLFKPLANVQNGGCHMDVYLPESTKNSVLDEPCPVAILVHGGSWVIGASTDIQPDSVNYLLRAGIAVVSLEYRLAPQVKVVDCVQDCLDGYRFVTDGRLSIALNQQLEQSQYRTLDLNKVSIVGYSAGAHLVSCMISKLPSLGLSPPRCMILFYGPSKLDELSPGPAAAWEQARELKPQEVAFAEMSYHGEVTTSVPIIGETKAITPRRAFLGITAQLNNLHSLIAAPTDGSEDNSRINLSAYYLATAAYPPTFLSWGDKDTLVPPCQNEFLRDKLLELKVETRWAIATDGIHGYAEREFRESRAPDGSWWVQAIQPAFDFLLCKVGISTAL